MNTSAQAQDLPFFTPRRLLLSLPALIALPMSLSNTTAQPLSILILAPYLLLGVRSNAFALFLPFYVCLTSYIQYTIDPHSHYSLYQFARSFVPFIYTVVFINSFDRISNYLRENLIELPKFQYYIEKFFAFIIFSHLVQAALFFFRLPGANIATSSEEADRVLLFPSTYALIVLLYFSIRQKPVQMGMCAILLLTSGSKTALVAMGVILAIALFSKLNVKTILKYAVFGAALGSVVQVTNPLAVERALQFVFEEQGQDYTREYEISHAREKFLSNDGTVLFGNGLAKALTPGVPTRDPAWAENSKFDIENAYWSLLSKLGVFGFAILIFSMLRMRFSVVSFALLCILAMYGLRTSYLFFTNFDGAFLILAAIIVDGLLREQKALDGAPALAKPNLNIRHGRAWAPKHR